MRLAVVKSGVLSSQSRETAWEKSIRLGLCRSTVAPAGMRPVVVWFFWARFPACCTLYPPITTGPWAMA